MKTNKSNLLFEYVIKQNDKINIEDLFIKFELTKLKFNKLKFNIKSQYSHKEYLTFLNKINGPMLLLLEDPIHIGVPKKMIELNMNKEKAIEYFDMTHEEFSTMLQNLKRLDINLYNELNNFLNKLKSKKIKKTKIKFNDIAQFIINKNCGYYQVCKELNVTDSYINTLLNYNKDNELTDQVKLILKNNKEYDKIFYKGCKEVFNNKYKLNLLKKQILSGKSIASIARHFDVRYNSLNKFIKNDLKNIDEKIYFDINYFLQLYSTYINLFNHCIEHNINYKTGCENLNINYKVFIKNIPYLKYTKEYKKIK